MKEELGTDSNLDGLDPIFTAQADPIPPVFRGEYVASKSPTNPSTPNSSEGEMNPFAKTNRPLPSVISVAKSDWAPQGHLAVMCTVSEEQARERPIVDDDDEFSVEQRESSRYFSVEHGSRRFFVGEELEHSGSGRLCHVSFLSLVFLSLVSIRFAN